MITFKRALNLINLKYMNQTYESQINYHNINKLSKSVIKNIFKDEDKELVEIYLHILVDKWFQNNYENTQSFLNIFKRLIRKTGIHLNEEEKHDLIILDERAFSIDRHIKVLEVDFKLLKHEKAGAKFTKAKIFQQISKHLKQLDEGDLILTNKRVLFKGQEEWAFVWKDMEHKEFEDIGFVFKSGSKKYVVRIHDQIALNNTIKNLLSKSKTK